MHLNGDNQAKQNKSHPTSTEQRVSRRRDGLVSLSLSVHRI